MYTQPFNQHTICRVLFGESLQQLSMFLSNLWTMFFDLMKVHKFPQISSMHSIRWKLWLWPCWPVRSSRCLWASLQGISAVDAVTRMRTIIYPIRIRNTNTLSSVRMWTGQRRCIYIDLCTVLINKYDFFFFSFPSSCRIQQEPKLLPQVEEVTYAEPVLLPQPPPQNKMHSPKNTLRKPPMHQMHQGPNSETLFQFQPDGYNTQQTYRGRDNFGTLRSHQVMVSRS